MFSITQNLSKTPTDQCKDMLNEVDSMLKLIKSRSTKRKISITKKSLPTEFLNAVRTLNNRITSGTDITAVFESNRLKLAHANHLGPGQYFKLNLNESCKLPRKMTVKDFESKKKIGPKQKSVISIRRKSTTTSPKDHNLKVKEKMEKRIEIHNMNNLRKRDRFKTQIQTQMKDSKKQYYTELLKLFVPLALVYGINLIISEKIKNKTKIRLRSTFLLRLWYWITRFLGVAKKNLKRIRKMIAAKNIGCITKPFLRFVVNKRQIYRGKVVKHIKFILKSNLLVLLQYKFLRAIRLIQSNFRKYRIIKATRIQILMKKCSDQGGNISKYWTHASVMAKSEILQKFYVDSTYQYAKAKVKYLYDTSAVNKKFVRNFQYWQMDSFNQAAGRNFTVTLPDPPQYELLKDVTKLCQFVNNFDYKNRKRKRMRSIILEKSYY